MADGVGMAAGTGALSGGMTGAKIGSLVPGVGTAAGAAVGAAIGGISSGMKAKKAADANNAIQAQDPQELARLAEIDRIRKSIGAGTDPLTQQQLGVNQQVGATTQGRIARSTGGAVGDTVTGLLRAQKGTQAANNQALAGSQQRLPFFENMGQQLRTRISQRALELGLQQRDQALAEKAARQKAVAANLSGALGELGNSANGGVAQGGAPGTGVAPQAGQQAPISPVGTDQNGLAAKSTFTEPSQVGIDASQPASLNTDFGVANNLLPAGFGAESQPQIGIANQDLNSPIQQVPIVSPLSQASAVGTPAANGNQSLIDQLAAQIRANPAGAPSQGQLGTMNQLEQ